MLIMDLSVGYMLGCMDHIFYKRAYKCSYTIQFKAREGVHPNAELKRSIRSYIILSDINDRIKSACNDN